MVFHGLYCNMFLRACTLFVLINYAASKGMVLADSHSQKQIPANRVECTSPPGSIPSITQLTALRNLMNSQTPPIHAVYVGTGDEHQTEYFANEDQRIQFISGFSGSNGEAIITQNKAALWTDSRYHIQAEREVDCNWSVMKSGNQGVPSKEQWLLTEFPQGARIAADPKLMPANTWNNLERNLKAIHQNFVLAQSTDNLIDQVWDKEEAEIKPAFILTEAYSGKFFLTKISETLQEIQALGADSMVVTALDEIAWLLNIRGEDIPYNYFLRSYVILTQNDVTLYTDPRKVQGNVTNYFAKYNTVKLKDYNAIWTDLPALSERSNKILVASSCMYNPGASKRIYDLVPENKRVFLESPIIYLKATKNSVEQTGMRVAQIKDAAALIKFFHFFETSFNAGDSWDEFRVAQEVNRFRYEQDSSPSFGTIAGFGPNGALPHYEPTESTSIPITGDSILVIDSGGQYFGGTTDTTRSIHLGTPTAFQKEIYTRVLMGCIQLSSLIFPANMEVSRMDVLARSALWEIGYDYGHGTGHGIGSFLGVHESPINIGFRSGYAQHFEPGYFTSNEPGCYLEGQFGVRLENIIEVVEKPTSGSETGFLGFTDITLVPYDTKLIDLNLLSNKHIRWLNEYNKRIRDLVGPELQRQNEMDAFNWMIEHTGEISERVFPVNADEPNSATDILNVVHIETKLAFLVLLHCCLYGIFRNY